MNEEVPGYNSFSETKLMGIIKKQGINGSIAIYLGILVGAFNSIYLFPRVFSDSPESMGLVQLIIAYSIVVGSFVGAGFPSGIVYFYPKFNQQQKEALFGYAIFFSGVLLFWAFCPFWFPDFWHHPFTNNPAESRPYLFHLLILVVTYVAFELLTGIMQSFRLVVLPAYLKDFGRKLVLTLLLLATSAGYITTLGQFMIWLLIFYAFLTIWLIVDYVKRVGLKFRFSLGDLDYSHVTKYSITILLTTFLYMWVSRIDMMMLGSMMESTAYVAFYTIAYQIGSVVWTPAKSLNWAIRPVLSEAIAKNDTAKVTQFYHQSATNQLFVSGLIFLLILNNLDFIYAFIPENYSSGQNVVWFISIGYLVNAMFGPNNLIINFTKAFKLDFYLNLIMLALIVALNYVFIPKYGVLGAAASTTFTTIATITKSIIVYNMMGIIPIKEKPCT